MTGEQRLKIGAMSEIPNPYLEPRKPSPGEKEVATGSLLVELFRLLGIRMVYQKDVDAVQRVGELVKRWWRNITFRSGS